MRLLFLLVLSACATDAPAPAVIVKGGDCAPCIQDGDCAPALFCDRAKTWNKDGIPLATWICRLPEDSTRNTDFACH